MKVFLQLVAAVFLVPSLTSASMSVDDLQISVFDLVTVFEEACNQLMTRTEIDETTLTAFRNACEGALAKADSLPDPASLEELGQLAADIAAVAALVVNINIDTRAPGFTFLQSLVSCWSLFRQTASELSNICKDLENGRTGGYLVLPELPSLATTTGAPAPSIELPGGMRPRTTRKPSFTEEVSSLTE